MNNAEAVNWLTNIIADIGKMEHQDLWHYEQALSEIRKMLEYTPQRIRGKWDEHQDYPGIAYLCNQCKYFSTIQTNFCPNCGADMRKG